MNIVEVLKIARPGQKIRRISWIGEQHIRISKDPADALVLENEKASWNIFFSTKFLLADDWEIVKEVKRVEADVQWRDYDGCTYPEGEIPGGWSQLLYKKGKLTFEWEE
jgi:hypothetical protein